MDSPLKKEKKKKKSKDIENVGDIQVLYVFLSHSRQFSRIEKLKLQA